MSRCLGRQQLEQAPPASPQGVRRKNFALVRERLQQRLFLAKPTFAGHLRRALDLVAELREVPLAAASVGHLVSLPEFSELQAATREQKAKPMLESVVERLQKVRGGPGAAAAAATDRRAQRSSDAASPVQSGSWPVLHWHTACRRT